MGLNDGSVNNSFMISSVEGQSLSNWSEGTSLIRGAAMIDPSGHFRVFEDFENQKFGIVDCSRVICEKIDVFYVDPYVVVWEAQATNPWTAQNNEGTIWVDTAGRMRYTDGVNSRTEIIITDQQNYPISNFAETIKTNENKVTDISINYVSKSSLSGQMDPNRFILTKSYNVPDTGPIGTWATYTSSPPATAGSPDWNDNDKGYYNLVADTDASFNDVRSYTGAASSYPGGKGSDTGQPNGTGSRSSIYTDSCQNSSISYINLQFEDGSGNDYGSPASNTTYGTTDAVLRDANGNDLIKYGDYILIERDGVGASGGYPNNYVILGPVDWILRPLNPAIQIGRNSTYPFWREGKGTLDGMIKISRLARYPADFSTPLDFTTLTDVSNTKLVDIYNNSSQFGNHFW